VYYPCGLLLCVNWTLVSRVFFVEGKVRPVRSGAGEEGAVLSGL
jgi:hypothetical protein